MLAIVLAIVVTAASQLKAAEINCSRIDRSKEFTVVCRFEKTFIISEDNVTFAGLENPEVDEIWFDVNKNIEFLPVQVYKKFPSSERYLAANLAIKKISASNFEKLVNLRTLVLTDNQIEFIPDDCFKNLNKLFEINLRNVINFFINNNYNFKIISNRKQQNCDSERSCFC